MVFSKIQSDFKSIDAYRLWDCIRPADVHRFAGLVGYAFYDFSNNKQTNELIFINKKAWSSVWNELSFGWMRFFSRFFYIWIVSKTKFWNLQMRLSRNPFFSVRRTSTASMRESIWNLIEFLKSLSPNQPSIIPRFFIFFFNSKKNPKKKK